MFSLISQIRFCLLSLISYKLLSCIVSFAARILWLSCIINQVSESGCIVLVTLHWSINLNTNLGDNSIIINFVMSELFVIYLEKWGSLSS
jgi:hypothetical protein